MLEEKSYTKPSHYGYSYNCSGLFSDTFASQFWTFDCKMFSFEQKPLSNYLNWFYFKHVSSSEDDNRLLNIAYDLIKKLKNKKCLVLQNRTCFKYLQELVLSHVGETNNDFFSNHNRCSYKIGWPASTEVLTPPPWIKNVAGYCRIGPVTSCETHETYVPTTLPWPEYELKTKINYQIFFYIILV